jgi:hypothetical protein
VPEGTQVVPADDTFTAEMTAYTVIDVTHPAGVLLDDRGDPVLDADGQPIFEENQT